MKTRIRTLIDKEKMTSQQFANEIGIGPSSLHHIVSGRNNPSLEVIQKILNRFSYLNADWLVNGKGNPYKDMVQGELFEFPNNEREVSDESYANKEVIKQVADTLNSSNKEQMIKIPKEGKEIEKIVFFYTDNSFKVFDNLS